MFNKFFTKGSPKELANCPSISSQNVYPNSWPIVKNFFYHSIKSWPTIKKFFYHSLKSWPTIKKYFTIELKPG